MMLILFVFLTLIYNVMIFSLNRIHWGFFFFFLIVQLKILFSAHGMNGEDTNKSGPFLFDNVFTLQNLKS